MPTIKQLLPSSERWLAFRLDVLCNVFIYVVVFAALGSRSEAGKDTYGLPLFLPYAEGTRPSPL